MAAKPLVILLSIRQGHKRIVGLVVPQPSPSSVVSSIVDNRDGTFSITGGGAIAITGVKGAAQTATITGGGAITMSGTKGGRALISVTGGGAVAVLGAKGGQLIGTVTGGGAITVSFRKNAEVTLNITGGGVITIASADPAVPISEIVIEVDEGGAGPVEKRRGQTPFDDWTIQMDDESITELYLLRRPR